MFDNTSPYTLRKEIVGGITHYYVSFTDGLNIRHETEVSRPVYLEFTRFVRIERSLRHWDERHKERSDLADEALHARAFRPQKSLEETVLDDIRNEKLRQAVRELPAKQRRRFILYYEFGLTYEQIADAENCTKRAVKFSVDYAKEKISKKIKNF